jgi:hypothetical protein
MSVISKYGTCWIRIDLGGFYDYSESKKAEKISKQFI